jgi:uncharacterized protein (TIGR02186 family)
MTELVRWSLRGLIAALLLALAPAAAAETLITSLSRHRVTINSNYTGTSIAVFGSIERDAQTVSRASSYQVVVTVRGPQQNLVVREKDAVGPLWINREQQKFPTAPAYLAVFTSGPLAEFTTDTLRRRQKVGLEAIVFGPDFTNDRGEADEPFRAALLRLKQREGLYLMDERGVTFLTPTIFRCEIPLPAIAPPGNYDVEVVLFADSVVLTRTQTSFELVKSGFEQQVGEVARDHSALYGLATGAFALLFGWLASVIFRRD